MKGEQGNTERRGSRRERKIEEGNERERDKKCQGGGMGEGEER